MPYPRTLQQYAQAEFYREPPDLWVKRLAEISPDMPNLDRLVFRWFSAKNPDGADRGWPINADREVCGGMWVLYAAKPIRMVEKHRARQFEKHWSELPEAEQAGRQAVVSDYQHFMWHSQGLYVRPFLILQGEWGGTPAKYTEQEKAFLKASHCLDEPFDIGMFPPCPFDERVVKQITTRDRLLQQSNSYGHLEDLDSSDGLGREFDDAERVKRETYLDTWKVMIQPAVEFYKRFVHTKEATRVLPKAPDGLANTLDGWKDHFLETGIIPGVTPARCRKVQMTVR